MSYVLYMCVCVCLMVRIQNVTQKHTTAQKKKCCTADRYVHLNGIPRLDPRSSLPALFVESVCQRPRRGGNHTLWVPIHPQAATKWDHQPVRVAHQRCFHCKWSFDYNISLIGSQSVAEEHQQIGVLNEPITL